MAVSPEHIAQNMHQLAYSGPICEGVELLAGTRRLDEKRDTFYEDVVLLTIQRPLGGGLVEVLIDNEWTNTAQIRQLREGRFGDYLVADFDTSAVEARLNGALERISGQLPESALDRIKRRFIKKHTGFQLSAANAQA